MNIFLSLSLIASSLSVLSTPLAAYDQVNAEHPEARPFKRSADAQADLDRALELAGENGQDVLVVMGANWCHDSRGLAGWFATPRFAFMLNQKYEVVYVDVGYRDRNLDIARGFGIDELKGTPTVLVVSDEAQLLNPKAAPTWRNAASRGEDAIFDYFANFEPEDAVYADE